MRQAADFYDRAAREPFGRIPAPTTAGNQLRRAARIMATYARLSGDGTNAWAILIVQLAALAEAVAELRQAQQRAAQAKAALTAAQQLHAVRPAPPAQPKAQPRARTAADLAAISFPAQWYYPAVRGPRQASTAWARPPAPPTGRHSPGHAARHDRPQQRPTRYLAGTWHIPLVYLGR